MRRRRRRPSEPPSGKADRAAPPLAGAGVSTRPPSPDPQDDPAHREAQRYRLGKGEVPTGWRYLSSVDNDIVGLWYTLGAFFFFAIVGVLALLMRTQLGVVMLPIAWPAALPGR